MEAITLQRVAIRPLRRDDLDAVVAIDATSVGYTRRGYFVRRLEAAMREPKLHAQFAATDDRGLAGYILARVLEGEFGRRAFELRLEVIGVRADARGHGIGSSLFDALSDHGRRHGIADVLTQAAWNDHRMLRWLDAMGFSLAPVHVVSCDVHGSEYVPERDQAAATVDDENAPHEIDYGARRGDFERLARDAVDVRAMEPADLAEILRIDRSITGRDRQAYVRHRLAEAMEDSAIRVSLTAQLDDFIVGFVMARVDVGDFGRTEAVAVLDTIGVDPKYAGRGVGHALLSQLCVNLGALRVEQGETIVAPHDLDLLGFLYSVGFRPSPRLAFLRRIE